jgi:hypothetical protein
MTFSDVVSVIKPVTELIVLVVILRELYTLRHHLHALHRHGKRLDDVMPLYPMLYCDNQKILDLALSFTREAGSICAIGWLSSLTSQRRRDGEVGEDFERRTAQARALVKATEDHILAGRYYCRVMDWLPTGDDMAWEEAKANAEFFLKLLALGDSRDLKLKLFHHPQVFGGRGDHHFRCSDTMVVLRIGGHGNNRANAAITITDARVIVQYRNYYDSLIDEPLAFEVTELRLRALASAFAVKDRASAAKILGAEA